MSATIESSPSVARQTPAAIELLDVIVLAGGPGVERDVSVQSGQAVADALTRLGHQVELRNISPDDLSAIGRQADFVFIALHGEFGEDGQVQSLLEERGLPYAGSRSAASKLAFDKAATKRRLEEAGIPTPKWTVVDKAGLSDSLDGFRLPVMLKPVASGSSVDTSIIRDRESYAREVARLVDQDGSALLESYVQGVELTVGVLGDQTLPVCEIRTEREFYDYQAKYLDDDTQYLFDIDLPKAFLENVSRMSLSAHKALGCSALSRVDWMVDAETMSPYVLEVNTIPGFTSHSLLPKSAARIGIGFDQLCQKIIELSLAAAGD